MAKEKSSGFDLIDYKHFADNAYLSMMMGLAFMADAREPHLSEIEDAAEVMNHVIHQKTGGECDNGDKSDLRPENFIRSMGTMLYHAVQFVRSGAIDRVDWDRQIPDRVFVPSSGKERDQDKAEFRQRFWGMTADPDVLKDLVAGLDLKQSALDRRYQVWNTICEFLAVYLSGRLEGVLPE